MHRELWLFCRNEYICNNIANLKLKRGPLYRKLIAALLLSVYLFIAAPVGWWHHHASTGSGGISIGFAISGNDELLHAHLSSGDCPVCSHHYSAFLETAFFRAEFTVQYLTPLHKKFCPEAYHSISISGLTNKGPPAC